MDCPLEEVEVIETMTMKEYNELVAIGEITPVRRALSARQFKKRRQRRLGSGSCKETASDYEQCMAAMNPCGPNYEVVDGRRRVRMLEDSEKKRRRYLNSSSN